jgi:hypothetical protein
VAAIESSYGQGQVWFDNYSSNGGAGAIVSNVGTGAGYTAALSWGFGTITDPALLTGSGIITAFNTAAPGYFTAGIVQIPGYTGGAITFQISAYNGTGYGSPTTTFQGKSQLFGEQSLALVGSTTPAGYFTTLTPFAVSPVPEPSTLALLGLGTGVLLFLRRRK